MKNGRVLQRNSGDISDEILKKIIKILKGILKYFPKKLERISKRKFENISQENLE